MSGKKRASVTYTNRSEKLANLRRTFTVPTARLSSLTLLPTADYAQYLLVPDWATRLATKRHLATVRSTKGAQASVYLMEDSSIGQLYVMKATSIDDAERVRLAVKEFEVLKGLDSPHIVKPLGFWIDQDSNRAALILPYLGEQTLEAVGKLPLDEVQRIGVQLFETLTYLHGQNWIHRDIKPANCLYSDGNLTLIDFQTATKIQTSQWLMTYAGTREFTAPEVRTQGVYSAKVDVWSAATLLLYLSGHKSSEDIGDTACSHWFRSALEPEPERRPTAEEALQHSWLRSVL